MQGSLLAVLDLVIWRTGPDGQDCESEINKTFLTRSAFDRFPFSDVPIEENIFLLKNKYLSRTDLQSGVYLGE